MKKYDLFRYDGSIIRVLDMQDDRVLVIDCIKHSMPVWVDVESLKSKSLQSESLKSELFNSKMLDSALLESYSESLKTCAQRSGKELSVCSDDELFETTGVVVVDVDALDADQRKVMYERYTMITPTGAVFGVVTYRCGMEDGIRLRMEMEEIMRFS